jgi:hypothetical protein
MVPQSAPSPEAAMSGKNMDLVVDREAELAWQASSLAQWVSASHDFCTLAYISNLQQQRSPKAVC